MIPCVYVFVSFIAHRIFYNCNSDRCTLANKAEQIIVAAAVDVGYRERRKAITNQSRP